MKRKRRKNVNLLSNKEATTKTIAFSERGGELWFYDEQTWAKKQLSEEKPILFADYAPQVVWLNVYGLQEQQAIRQLAVQNKLDEFILNLTAESDHRNKFIELSNCFFFTLKSPAIYQQGEVLEFEQMFFIVGTESSFIWTMQEKHGDHFDHIRTRIEKNIGLVRQKKADYLFYLLVEAVVDNYYVIYEQVSHENSHLKDYSKVRATADFAALVEEYKAELFQIKKVANTLKDALGRLEKSELPNFNNKYLTELREQISYLNDEIDFSWQQLESSIQLIINIQNNRLNEVMRTLTIFSVLFIPLTFIAGIYGMNFDFMPELHTRYGYYVVLGVMVVAAFVVLTYFKRKKWFD